jgi:hypothetical protein
MYDMKKTIYSIIILGCISLAFFNRAFLAIKVNQIIYQSPCDTPKTFSIGTIDLRFNLSKSQLIQDTEETSSFWKNNQGINIMQYDPSSKFTISMVYDERQYLNSQINNLNSQVEQQQQTLKPELSNYEHRAATFKQKNADLNNRIAYWNQQGGAPQEEYDKLVADQKALQKESATLEQMAKDLNQSTDQYNTQMQQLDQKVDQYNTTLQGKPEEGLYMRNGNDEKIVIYFNNSHNELIHTIAHEMGHAIGLAHTTNPQSIMYPKTSSSLEPTIDDLAEIATACKKRNVIMTMLENLSLNINMLMQMITTKK